MDPQIVIIILALIGAVLSLGGGIALAAFLNRGAAEREKAYLSALDAERNALASIERDREKERVEAREYRDVTEKRLANMERELIAVKRELELVKAQREIERATFMALLRQQNGGKPSDAGYEADIPQNEDVPMMNWISSHFKMDGDIEILAANGALETPPPGQVTARSEWLVRWARSHGMSGNLAKAAKALRPRIRSWQEGE